MRSNNNSNNNNNNNGMGDYNSMRSRPTDSSRTVFVGNLDYSVE
jgi:RNA recognition motif-containing protein